jgi:molybdenum cofactor cytidylyltransferase
MICAVVLAAGRSLRMGTQKLLLPVAGKPLIARIVDELLRSPVDETFVVTGTDGTRISEALAGRRVHFVVNPERDGDMLSSVRCGLRALPESCRAVLVVLGDQPRLTAEMVGKLIGAFHQCGPGIVVPVHGQRRGHPLLFSIRFRDEILQRFDGAGLRGLLEAHPQEIAEITVEDQRVLDDVDTPENFRRLTEESGAS